MAWPLSWWRRFRYRGAAQPRRGRQLSSRRAERHGGAAGRHYGYVLENGRVVAGWRRRDPAHQRGREGILSGIGYRRAPQLPRRQTLSAPQNAGSPEGGERTKQMDKTQSEAGAAAASFYDALRSGSVSSAALGYGGDFVGQECTLLPREMLIFARRAGVAAGTSVLDVGSGTGARRAFSPSNLAARCSAWTFPPSATNGPCAGEGSRPRRPGTIRLGDIQDIDLPPPRLTS